MHRIIRAGEIPRSAGGTLVFEGEPFGSDVSFFLVETRPGAGPVLHRHPYAETWIVRSGHARFLAGDEAIEAGPGDIVVVGAGTPHRFTNTGDDRLDMVCIHPSPRFVQEDLDG